MLGYTINFKCKDFDNVDILKTDVLSNENIIILLNNTCDNSLKNYYTQVRKLILNNNRLIILNKGSGIIKQIGMLMCLYEKYDIYDIEDNQLNTDYLSTLLDREPTADEVVTFINADLVGFAEINNILTTMLDCIKHKDLNSLTSLLGEQLEEIEGFIGLIDYLRVITNDTITEKANNNTEELQAQITELQSDLAVKEKRLREANDKCNTFQKEISRCKSDISILNNKITSLSEAEPVLVTYNELKTQIIKCKTQSILYFKEINHISYINSFISNLILALEKIRKLKVKLIIYDNKNAFLKAYEPVKLISSYDYASDKTRVVDTLKKMLLTEPNQSILEDVLGAKWDVVIIYDRLKQATDLVTGNIVYKYWVLNSAKEFSAIEKEFNARECDVITRPGVLPDALAISTYSEYKQGNDSTKLAYYLTKMKNTGNNQELVFSSIFKRANITEIQAM